MPFDAFPSPDRVEVPAAAIERWRRYILKNPSCHATMDFETRSECDLKKHGSWIYSKHPSTQALCLSYNLPGSEKVHRWHREHHPRSPWNEDAPEHYIPESEAPTELFAFILAGGLVEAHNMMFERVIWTNVMTVQHGWPDLIVENLRCSASRASYASLPRSLEMAAKAMALPIEKDMEGRALMLKMTKPRKPRKAEREAWEAHCEENDLGDLPHPTIYYETEEAIYRNQEYCDQDVLTEMAFSAVCPVLEQRELELWQLDQEMNWTGTAFDLDLATIALKRAEEWKEVLNDELFHITGVERGSQRQKVKDWLKKTGLVIPDTTAETIDWYLENYEFTDDRHARVLEIVKQVNRTSVRKYQAMLSKTDREDGHARDLLMYHGASTGRWSGKGIQVQNFPRGNSKNKTYIRDGEESDTFDMDRACAELKDRALSTSMLGLLNGDVMELLSSSLRGGVIPSEGYELIVADYSAIEARCVLWAAGAEHALEVFRSGGDIYCDMATGIYGYEVNKKDHPEERQFGKQAILGLGYGMGFITFLITCKKYNIKFSVEQVKKIVGKPYEKYYGWVKNYLWPEQRKGETAKDFRKRKATASKNKRKLKEKRLEPEKVVHELVLMKYTVDVYRSRYPEVKQLWADQNDAAIEAVKLYEEEFSAALDEMADEDLLGDAPEELRQAFEGSTVEAGKFAWFVRAGFLCCRLPSGRLLRYRDPFLKKEMTDWGEERDSLRYYTTIVGGRWARQSTYGGKVVENEIQAVARDVMADAMLRMIKQYDDAEEKVASIIELLKRSKYKPLMTVHDELVCQVLKGEGDVEEFEQMLCDVGPWADGCPIAAEGMIMPRYRKA